MFQRGVTKKVRRGVGISGGKNLFSRCSAYAKILLFFDEMINILTDFWLKFTEFRSTVPIAARAKNWEFWPFQSKNSIIIKQKIYIFSLGSE